MIWFEAIKGNFNKYYLQVKYENNEDLKTLKIVEKIVTREEWKFTGKGGKMIKESYFIDSTFIPATFIKDLIKGLTPILDYPLVIKNQEILFNTRLTRAMFDDWLETVILPEKYNIYDPKYAYQPSAVFSAVLMKTGRVSIGTGGGKTLIQFLYCKFLIENLYKKSNKRILIVLNREDLVKQTKKAFVEFDEVNDVKINFETIYAKPEDIVKAKVLIGTYQSLRNYGKEFFDAFSVFIVDEAQGAKSYSIRTEIFSKCEQLEYILGLTATWPNYNTLDYLNIVSMLGPEVFVKHISELIADGNVTPVLINRIEINYIGIDADFSRNLRKNEDLTGAEIYRIEKKFFETHVERNRLVVKIVKTQPYNHLILVESVEYCTILRNMILSECPDKEVYIVTGTTKNRHEIYAMAEAADNIVIVATYETMSVGVSINNIMHVHFPNGGRSAYRVIQGIGRIVRLHIAKEYGIVWDYFDNLMKSSFKNHSKERLLMYISEKHPIHYHTVTLKDEYQDYYQKYENQN